MNVFIMPDKNLMVPCALEDNGTLGDGLELITMEDPRYKEWMDWVSNNEDQVKPYPMEILDVDDGLVGEYDVNT